MKKSLVLLLLLLSQHLSSQSAIELFERANEHYKLGQYDQAIATYRKIEALRLISSELYFNLGNSYYKLDKIAPAIYNYEKALLINPSNKDAQNNLVFAQRLTIDAIDVIPETVFQKLDALLSKKLSYDQWSIFAVASSVVGVAFFLLFYLSQTPSKKRKFFITSMISFLFLLLSSILTAKEYASSNSLKEAIIFAEQTDVKNAPTPNGEKIFTLHEGTKVQILDAVDTWKKIKISDGKIGWVVSGDLKLLTIF